MGVGLGVEPESPQEEMKLQEKLGKRPRTSGWGLAETASHACIWNFARLGAMPTQSKRHRIRYLASVCTFWSQTPPVSL